MRDYAALGLIAGSFLFEVMADYQKSSWRHKKNHKQHDEKFITHGLWSISRHPNYLGELGIWTGIWALSSSALRTPYFPSGTVLLAALSPAMTYFLLRKVRVCSVRGPIKLNGISFPAFRHLNVKQRSAGETILSGKNTKSRSRVLSMVHCLTSPRLDLSLSSGHGIRRTNLYAISSTAFFVLA